MPPTSDARPQGALQYRWVILVAGILAYATSQFSRQNYTGVQKFIAADLGLDRGELGLLGSAFFYAYALFQMPWGLASDRVGSRAVIGVGILLTAGTMVGFALGETTGSLTFWRIASGVAAAAVYVPLTGGIARWFPDRERGFSQGTLGGVGGAVGEGAAYVLLPVLSIYFASGWRQGMHMIAAAIAVIGVVCLLLFRSAPSSQLATTRKPFDWTVLRDLQLWCYAFLWSGFVVGIRLTQIWIAVYAAEVYIAERGLSVNEAVVRGGLLALLAYPPGQGTGGRLSPGRADVGHAGPAGRVAHGGPHRMAGGWDGPARDAGARGHGHLGAGPHYDAARHVGEPVLAGGGRDLRHLRAPAHRVALLVRQHHGAVGRRDRLGRQRLRRHLAQRATRQRADRISRHLVVGSGRHGDHDGLGSRCLRGPAHRMGDPAHRGYHGARSIDVPLSTRDAGLDHFSEVSTPHNADLDPTCARRHNACGGTHHEQTDV